MYCEKVKLITKVHAASITASGLPHLTVSEMALVKNIATKKDDKEIQDKIHEKLKEMEKTASMLDTHMKWTRKSHVFHTWMVKKKNFNLSLFLFLLFSLNVYISEHSFRHM